MLPKQYRFSKTENKYWLNLQKSRTSSNFFSVLYSLKNDLVAPKIAISVGVSVSKSSVKRHKIKRLISESLFSCVSSVRPGLYVFIAKKTLLGVKYKNIQNEIGENIKKINRQ